jgi:hypothetical protein
VFVKSLSMVGFGDISAHSDFARLVVCVQMLADLVLIGTAVRVHAARLRKRYLMCSQSRPRERATAIASSLLPTSSLR